MKRVCLVASAALALLPLLVSDSSADPWRSTRITDATQHERQGPRSYPYREKTEMILRELDLQPGNAVADIGSGDGFWTNLMAEAVGPTGTVHTGEVDEKKVTALKKKFASVPQVKPYVCPLDGPGLPDESCDLAYLSQTYHHLPKDRRAYLEQLRKVVRPTGRLVVIEKYPLIATKANGHGTNLSELLAVCEQVGWMPLRIELIPHTYHFLAVFAQQEMFPPEQ